MSLEIRGFGERGEPSGVFPLANAAGVLAAGGEFVHQAVEAVDGPAVRGLFGPLVSLQRLAGLGLGDGIAAPSGRVEFFVLGKLGKLGTDYGLFDFSCDSW